MVLLPLERIIVDNDVQPRVELNEDALLDYIDVLNHGGELPPVEVFETPEGEYILSEGFHRYEAHSQVGKPDIEVNILKGNRRDAILHAMEANLRHGIRLTSADKRRMATRLLKDPEWGQYSAVRIAAMVGVSQPTVSSLRNELIEAGEIEAKPLKIERGGETYEFKGRRKKEEVEKEPVQRSLELVPDRVDEADASANEQEHLEEELQPLIPPIEIKPIPPDRMLMLSSVKYGDVYTMGKHKLYLNSLGKVAKKLKDFDYCMWFDTTEKLKEQSSWLFDHVAIVTIATRFGYTIRSLDQLGLTWQSGTLVNFQNRAFFLGHFSVDQVELADYGASHGEMLLDDPIKEFTDVGSTVLIVQPDFNVLPYLHAHDRVTTIVTTNTDRAQKELINWEESYGDTLPVKK
jgi:uncharacterized ParB-like nuclease family protein